MATISKRKGLVTRTVFEIRTVIDEYRSQVAGGFTELNYVYVLDGQVLRRVWTISNIWSGKLIVSLYFACLQK